MTEANLVIFASVTGREPWHPIKPNEVPDWVKQPKIMSRLANGEECMDCAEGINGSLWYRAVRVEEIMESVKH